MTSDLKGSSKPGKHLLTSLMVLFVMTLGVGIGTLITNHATATGPGGSQLKIQTDGKPVVGQAVLALSQAFEEVAKRVEPAVVNINTEEVVRLPRGRSNVPRGEDPMQDLFHQFLNPGQNMPEQFTRQSLGSGVLVDPKGYILTNNHVVGGASKIKVNLLDGEEYIAKVIAADELSDLAVIKIEGSKEFPYSKVGDSKAMKVGDWVLAIGSPFGLEHTVTAGIISATGRKFDTSVADTANYRSMLYNDYLQTDAAINSGNSGGPLVNMNGEVVGINSFISTQSRSSAGVGFAVPSHIFANIYNQIIDKGRVTRGWMGISMNLLPFTPELAKFFGVKQGGGVLITGFSDDQGQPAENAGPAARAGLKAEDVVVEFNGKKVFAVQDLRLAVANTPPGEKVPVRLVRNGEEKSFQVTILERPNLEKQDAGTFSFEEKEEQPKAEIGLSFDNVPPRLAQEAGVPGGAVLLSVKPGSLAEDAGLQPQEIIVAANGKKISTAQDLLNIVKSAKSGDGIVLKFLHIGRDRNRTVVQTSYTSIVKP